MIRRSAHRAHSPCHSFYSAPCLSRREDRCYRVHRDENRAVVIDSPPNLLDLRPRTSWLRQRAHELLSRFHRLFPALGYDLAWYSDSVNAQAFIDRGRRRVRLYGGLARHRRITRAGIAFALAHETGHHVAGAPFDPVYGWLSSESRADEWALEKGMIELFGPRSGPRLARRGLSELLSLSPIGDTGTAHRRQLLQANQGNRISTVE